MHVYFVECMFVCVDSLTCCLREPRGRLAMPNELPSINKDFHFTSLHFTSLHFTCMHVRPVQYTDVMQKDFTISI